MAPEIDPRILEMGAKGLEELFRSHTGFNGVITPFAPMPCPECQQKACDLASLYARSRPVSLADLRDTDGTKDGGR